MSLRAELLGGVRFSVAGEEVRPKSRKGTALLAYLCLRPEGARRDDLAELFWGPGKLPNLRQELYALRRLPGADEWLVEGDEVVSVAVVTDVAQMEAQEDAGAIAAVAGQLLPELARIDAPAFRDWLEHERLRVRESIARLRLERAGRLEEEGRAAEALALVDAALEDEPLDERLHRIGIRSAYRTGDTAAALERFESCRRTLWREVAAEPSEETLALVAAIRRGEPLSAALDPAVLAPELRGLVQALVVADGTLDVESLARVVERRPLDVAVDLARLERGGWLDAHLAVPAELARRTVRATPAVVKRLLHSRVAEVLSEIPGSAPATVAMHLLRAARPSEAAPRLLEAAESLMDSGAVGEAVPLLFRALWAAWEGREVRLRAALLLEGCASQSGDQALQDAALSEAERLAWEMQSDESLAEVRMRRSRLLLRRGRVGEGLERALEALEIAVRLGDDRLVARARNAVGGAQYYAGDVDGAEQSFGSNVGASDVVERYRARNNLGSIAGIKGRPREALVHLEEALTLGRAAGKIGDVIGTLNNIAATAERLGEYRRAEKYLKESLSLARRSGSALHEGQVLVNLAVLYSRLGDLGPAWNTACEVEELASEHDIPRLRMLALEQKGEVALLCGHDELAQAEIQAASELATALGDQRKVAAMQMAAAVVAARLDEERLSAAAQELEARDEPRLADVAPWFWLEIATSTGDAREASDWTQKAESFAAGNAHMKAVVALARLRAGLLEGASAAQVEAARTAFVALTGAEAGGGYLTDLEFVQAPHARLVAARWQAASSQLDSEAVEALAERVTAELSEQAAGLPRELATCLLARPTRWSTRLGGTPLTVD